MMQHQLPNISITSAQEYENALERLYDLMQMDLVADQIAADEFVTLSILVEQYESIHYPLPSAHPTEAIKFRLEQLGRSA